jgi:hypothetical protein
MNEFIGIFFDEFHRNSHYECIHQKLMNSSKIFTMNFIDYKLYFAMNYIVSLISRIKSFEKHKKLGKK